MCLPYTYVVTMHSGSSKAIAETRHQGPVAAASDHPAYRLEVMKVVLFS